MRNILLGLFITVLFINIASAVGTSGVLTFNFDEGTGITIRDTTNVTNLSFDTDKNITWKNITNTYYYLNFNSTANQSVQGNLSNIFNYYTHQPVVSIFAWVNYTNKTGFNMKNSILANEYNVTSYFNFYINENNTLGYRYVPYGTFRIHESEVALTPGVWNMVGVVCEYNTVKLYLGNTVIATSANIYNVCSGTRLPENVNYNNFTIGNSMLSSNYEFNGSIAGLMISNHSVTSSEILDFWSSFRGLLYYENITYNPAAQESSWQAFNLSLIYPSDAFTSIVIDLIYNNTVYSTNKTANGDNINAYVQLSTPTIGQNNNTNISFYFRTALTNTSGTYYYNSTSFNQTIVATKIILCDSAYNKPMLNITFYNITSLSKINSNLEVTFNFYVNDSDGSFIRTYSYKNNTGAAEYLFCIYPNNTQIKANAEFSFDADGYVKNFFYYNKKELNNITTNQSFYLLSSGKATLLTFRILNNLNIGLQERFIYVYHYDIGAGVNYLLSVLKTNQNGEDIAYLEWYNQPYSIKVYDIDNNLKYNSQPQKISATPLTIKIVDTDSYTYDKFWDVDANVNYDNTTSIATVTFNDPTSKITHGCMRIIRSYKGENTIVYDNCIAGTSGTLSYYINDGDGSYYIVFYAKGPLGSALKMIQIVIDTADSIYNTIGNLEGSTLAFILTGSAAFIGIVISPAAAVIFTILGLLGSALMGFQNVATPGFWYSFMLISAVGGYLIWKMKN